MPHDPADLNPELHNSLADLQAFLHKASQDGSALHEVERALRGKVLRIGHQSLRLFLSLEGSGDQGPDLRLPGGRELRRLPELHPRPYVSVFGPFTLHRSAYGSREGQKIEFVPLVAGSRLRPIHSWS